MGDKTLYECDSCGGRREVKAEAAGAPDCCGQPMQKMADPDFCQTSNTAEHARADQIEEPCDDGRGGKI